MVTLTGSGGGIHRTMQFETLVSFRFCFGLFRLFVSGAEIEKMPLRNLMMAGLNWMSTFIEKRSSEERMFEY